MSETTVETILDTLEAELKQYIKVSRDYRTTPTTIYRGAFSPTEVQAFPVVGYDITAEDYEIVYQGEDNVAYVEVMLYGYTYTDGVDRVSDVRNLAHDVLHFIHNDFSYSDVTEILDKLGYNGYKTLVFNLPIRIMFEYNNSTIG